LDHIFYIEAQFTRIHPTEFPEFVIFWDRKSNLSDQHFNVFTVRVRKIYTDETEIKGELEVHESSIFIV